MSRFAAWPRLAAAYMLVALGALSAFGPISLDLYLPSLPELSRDLHVSDSLGQLTMSACMAGLALGQLVYGPLSDRFGRRLPLLVGVAMFVIASATCALASSALPLVGLRFLQGLGGSAGIVISWAIVRDRYEGAEAARAFSRLQIVSGIAPVAAPLAGGALLTVMDWRGIFLVLAGVGVVLFVVALTGVRETLGPEQRHSGGIALQISGMARLVAHRRFALYAILGALASTTLFVYISTSSFIFQNQFDITQQQFSVIFAINSVGLIASSQLNAMLVRRLGLRVLVGAALGVGLAGAIVIVATGLLQAPLVAVLIPLFFVVASVSVVLPNVTVLALGPVETNVGAAAALIGTGQFFLGALVPPLASVGGVSTTAMGVTMVATSAIALLMLLATRSDPGASGSGLRHEPVGQDPTTPGQASAPGVREPDGTRA